VDFVFTVEPIVLDVVFFIVSVVHCGAVHKSYFHHIVIRKHGIFRKRQCDLMKGEGEK